MSKFSYSFMALTCFAAFAFIPARAAFAIDVYVAPIVWIDEAGLSPTPFKTPEKYLSEDLGGRAFDGKVSVFPASMRGGVAPRSLLEAMRAAEESGHEYLIYGFVKKSDETLHAELKLLDVRAKSIAAVFWGSDSKDRYERLMMDLADKVAAYFKDSLDAGPGRRADEPDAVHAWSLPVSLGYWAPFSEGWNKSLSGLVRVKAGVRFWPKRPAYVKHSSRRQLGFGGDFEYAIGMSSPGYEEAFVHSLLWRFVGDIATEWGLRGELGLGAGPFLRVDILSQSRKYSSLYSDASSAIGLGLEGWYSYALSERISLGFSLGLDITLYEKLMASFSPGLRFEYRFFSATEDNNGSM